MKRIVGAAASLALVARRWFGRPRATARGEPGADELNDAFHASYDEARKNAELEGPVFVLLADTLIVFRDERRRERRFTRSEYHLIKAAAHAPVALFAAMFDAPDGPLDARTRTTLVAIRQAAQRSAAGFELLGAEAAGDVRGAVATSLACLERMLAEDRVSRAWLEAFAAQAGPLLLRLTEHATKTQLASLHAAVEDELGALSDEERGALHVVVAGEHQARVRSLGMQYFQRRFGEPAGAETRVTYAEAVDSPADALALVGKLRFDRAIAVAFFGDPKRLQRDVLGDAAASLLGSTRLERIP